MLKLSISIILHIIQRFSSLVSEKHLVLTAIKHLQIFKYLRLAKFKTISPSRMILNKAIVSSWLMPRTDVSFIARISSPLREKVDKNSNISQKNISN